MRIKKLLIILSAVCILSAGCGNKKDTDNNTAVTSGISEQEIPTVTVTPETSGSTPGGNNTLTPTSEVTETLTPTSVPVTETPTPTVCTPTPTEAIEESDILNITTTEELLSYTSDGRLVLPENIKKLVLSENVSIKSGDRDIEFDIPDVAVTWTGSGAPTDAYAEHYMNVKSYNGKVVNSVLGGPGKNRILSGTLVDAKGNSSPLVLDGNYINVSTGYTRLSDLSTAKPDVKLSDEGNCALENREGSYYLNVNDNDGKKRCYRLIIDSPAYALPIIHLSTNSGKAVTSKENYTEGHFSIDYNGGYSFAPVTDAEMKIRGRGQTSWKLPKKPYKIKFAEKTSLFGLTASKEWVLIANHTDRTLLRNTLAMSMGQILDNMVFVPHSYLVDVFLNGKYVGIYSLSEQIEIKDGRIPGEKDSTAVDTDYLLEMGGDEEKTSFGINAFSNDILSYTVVKEPDPETLTYEQYMFAADYMNRASAAVKALSGYDELIDIPSLIDWFILEEFSYNLDCVLRRSNYFLKVKGDKLYYASPWDFDYAFGNFWRDSAQFKEWICLGNANTENYIYDNWMTYLLKDPNFISRLKARWEEVGPLLYETAINTIDKNAELMAASVKENYTVWTGCFNGKKIQYENPKAAAVKSWEGSLDYLKNFINNRYAWMDQTIKSMQ